MYEKHWDDFEVEQKVVSSCITITETHLVNWAHLTMDFYPLHMDEEYARKTIFKGRIVHGPFTFGLAVGLIGSTGVFGTSIMAWLGVENMVIPKPVRINDTIYAQATVLSKKKTKRADRGIVTLRYEVFNQTGEMVMGFDYLLMMHRK